MVTRDTHRVPKDESRLVEANARVESNGSDASDGRSERGTRRRGGGEEMGE